MTWDTTRHLCDCQAVFYDVTNEIEFKYDTQCDLRTDYMTIGYMDHTKTHGATMRNPGTGYIYGGNPFTNYRITTDGTSHSFETFPLGMTPVTNGQAVITGTSSGGIRGSYCDDTYWWNQYSSTSNANIDIRQDSHDYFQKSFDGDDSNDRLRIGRLGYLYFIDSGSRFGTRRIFMEHEHASTSFNRYLRTSRNHCTLVAFLFLW